MSNGSAFTDNIHRDNVEFYLPEKKLIKFVLGLLVLVLTEN